MHDNEIIEFLPDAISIRESQLPKWAQHGILWITGFLFIAIIWSIVCKIDIIVIAKGKLVSDHPTVVMKPLERTVLKKINVAIGDRVKKGDILATFDPVFSIADKERLDAEVKMYNARYSRIISEFKNTDYIINDNQSTESLVQMQLFHDRKQFYNERCEYFKHDIERIERSITSVKENLFVQRLRLKGFKEIESIVNKGHEKGATSHREYIESQNTRRALEAEIGDKENNIHVLESELQARKAEYKAFLREWRVRIAEELTRVETDLVKTKKEFAKAERMASYVELRAPENAMVHDIAPLSVGSAVREAETLLTLVPLDGKIEVEAEIGAEDIGRVHEGAEVRIKVTAFPFQKYGTLRGIVRFISEDSFDNRERNESKKDISSSFYRTRITITDADNTKYNIIEKLIPGMNVQAEIIVGTRSIISYFLNPLTKSLDEAIREP